MSSAPHTHTSNRFQLLVPTKPRLPRSKPRIPPTGRGDTVECGAVLPDALDPLERGIGRKFASIEKKKKKSSIWISVAGTDGLGTISIERQLGVAAKEQDQSAVARLQPEPVFSTGRVHFQASFQIGPTSPRTSCELGLWRVPRRDLLFAVRPLFRPGLVVAGTWCRAHVVCVGHVGLRARRCAGDMWGSMSGGLRGCWGRAVDWKSLLADPARRTNSRGLNELLKFALAVELEPGPMLKNHS